MRHSKNLSYNSACLKLYDIRKKIQKSQLRHFNVDFNQLSQRSTEDKKQLDLIT